MIWVAPLFWLASGLTGQTAVSPGVKDRAATISRPDARCGSYSLFVALKASGVDVGPFEAMEKALGPPATAGYSLLQLKEHALKSPAHAIAVDSTIENIRARRRPFGCVALLKDNHFVTLYDADETTAYLVDDFKLVDLPIETFLYLWTGKALIVAPGPLEAEESMRPARRRWLLAGALGASIALLGTLALWLRSRAGSKV